MEPWLLISKIDAHFNIPGCRAPVSTAALIEVPPIKFVAAQGNPEKLRRYQRATKLEVLTPSKRRFALRLGFRRKTPDEVEYEVQRLVRLICGKSYRG